MTDELHLLDETITSILERHRTRELGPDDHEGIPRQLWRDLEDTGLTTLALPENGGGLPELVVLARAVGRAAAPVPLVETAGLACWLLASAGMALPVGITTSATASPNDNLSITRTTDGWAAHGSLHRVPWGVAADCIVALARSDDGLQVVVLPPPSRFVRGRNLANEPRDVLHYDGVLLPTSAVAIASVTSEALMARGALLRSASIGGAMERVLDMSLAHANAREQFGRSLASFQAVQFHLVAIAEESVATGMAVRAASVATGPDFLFSIAAAKTTASTGAPVVAARAHQVHGAIGTTMEHSLHHFTTRLWSWQDEFGTAQAWSRRIGQDVLDSGPKALWPRISASGSQTPAG
jgi:acyl-CoA dehydrogenase